jgi:hypothetical protein
MQRLHDDEMPPPDDTSRDRGVAITIALSIIICLTAFVWIFIQLDPFLDDFTGTDVTVTADPAASPVDETDTTIPTPTP